MNPFLEQAFDVGVELACKEAGLWGAAKGLWNIGKGAWNTLPEVAKQVGGFGLFGGGINAALGDPEQSIAKRFGRGFAGGAAGGLGWYAGAKGMRGLTGMAARSRLAQRYAPGAAKYIGQASGGAGKLPLKWSGPGGVWSNFKTPGSRVEALKQFGGYATAGVPAAAGAWWLSGKADEAMQKHLGDQSAASQAFDRYGPPAVSAARQFMLPLEPGQEQYGQ